MATFYNSPITYNDATTPYNGQPITYTYSGSISLVLLPKYNLQTIMYYPGDLSLQFDVGSSYHRGLIVSPTTSGFRMLIAPSSTTVIRRYLKVKDPIRTGGCPQCGTFLYNG